MGTGYISPLQLWQQTDLLENRPDNWRTLAALFETTVHAPGFDDVSAADVRRMRTAPRQALHVAVLKTAGLWDADADSADSNTDADTTESDRIHTLHELGYEYPAIYGLLTREIELASEGAKRAADRRDDGQPTPDSVESAEGTQMRGGPAEGVDKIGFVDDQGEPLTN